MGKPPNLKHLRIWGSVAYEHIPRQFTKKFDVRARKVVLVGYQNNSANYRLYNPVTKKVSMSRDVIVRERTGMTAGTEVQSEDDEVEVTLPPTRAVEAQVDAQNPEEEEDEDQPAETDNQQGAARAVQAQQPDGYDAQWGI